MSYGIDNIQHLETREAIRLRVNMYLGSNDTEGIYQALKEIINNSTDEALAGYGNKITVKVNEEKNEVTILDEGRGVPWGIKDGRNILVAIYTESHTGGKFDKGGYKNSSGLNGIGGTAVCMSSEYFSVASCRDGKIATASFEKGNLIDYKEVDNKNKLHTGTTVIFKPDIEVFKDMTDTYSYKRICKELKDISYLNKGVRFIVTNENTGETEEFYSENGIADFINDKIENPLMRRPIIVSQSDGTDEIEVAFMWTKDPTQFYTFVNGLFCPENGSPVTAAKRAFTTQIKKLSGKDFDPELIRKGLVFAVNCRVSEPSFANQTKSKVNNPSLGTLTNAAIKQGLEEFSNTAEFTTIIEMLKKIQSAEKAADKAREAVLSQNKEIEKELKKKIVLAEKLADCRFHDVRSQLMICEGKSAKGALIKARNSDTTACFDLRGKLINTLKNDEEKVAKNEEITQLHIALGCGLGDKFNIKKLRYGKIIIMADMDEYFVH